MSNLGIVSRILTIVDSQLVRFLARPQPQRHSAILDLEDQIWHLAKYGPYNVLNMLSLIEQCIDAADKSDASSASTAETSSSGRTTRTPTGNKRKIRDEEKDLKDNAQTSTLIEYAIREAKERSKGNLLDCIANSRRKFNGHEESLFFHLVRLSHDKIAAYLLDKCRINLESQNGPEGRTALYEAVAAKKKGLMLNILNSQFMSPSKYINIGDADGDTALHYLLTFEAKDKATDDATVSELLTGILEHGPDIDATNKFGRTPLQWLILQGGQSIESIAYLEILCKAGAELNTKDVYGTCSISLG